MLTANESLGLKDLRLSNFQWMLLEQLDLVLEIFRAPTEVFLQAEVPLIHEVITVFLKVKRQLENIRDNKGESPVHPLHSDIDWVAIVMCPDKKPNWFYRKERGKPEIERLKNMVTLRFYLLNPVASDSENKPSLAARKCEWDDEDEGLSHSSKPLTLDTIEYYLASHIVSVDVLGGEKNYNVLGYWSNQLRLDPKSRVAKFALAFLTAQATSVDAERAFSCAWLMSNLLQQQMGSQALCAKMALRSWYKTPLLSDMDHVTRIIEEQAAGVPESNE
ncbi:hAT family dimerization protein [Ceratobasidium sp. AG-Ba]|nr:hAT family dimerization protein [Ceratobasidium sp. AG-Ba]